VLKIDQVGENKKILNFIKNTLSNTGIKNVVLGMSGGIDSTVALYLLKEYLLPENIFIAHLYYKENHFNKIEKILNDFKIPTNNITLFSIEQIVAKFAHSLKIEPGDNQLGKIRIGNICARIRMTILYDLAKKNKALVCGTENRSEKLLGYFTLHGDQASDIEPIQHLYKTQVVHLAKYLNIPEQIITQKPTAGLWTGQTDESEFGFTYQEADQVLYLYFNKKEDLEEIEKKGFKNARKIIDFAKKNSFKHRTPYIIK